MDLICLPNSRELDGRTRGCISPHERKCYRYSGISEGGQFYESDLVSYVSVIALRGLYMGMARDESFAFLKL